MSCSPPLIFLVCLAVWLSQPACWAKSLVTHIDLQVQPEPSGLYRYTYSVAVAPESDLSLISFGFEFMGGAELDAITGPPGFEIMYEPKPAGEYNSIYWASIFNFTLVPPGQTAVFEFQTPNGFTSDEYYAIVGIDDFEHFNTDGFEGLLPTPFSRYRPGDANGDDQVDLADFGTLKANFGGPGAWSQGDFDADGKVALTDFGLLKTNFGKSGSATAVPEPNSWMLLSIGALLSLSSLRWHLSSRGVEVASAEKTRSRLRQLDA